MCEELVQEGLPEIGVPSPNAMPCPTEGHTTAAPEFQQFTLAHSSHSPGTMAPFGSAAVPDSDFSFFSTLPPLDTRARSPEASSFFSLDDKPEKFVLALIDEASGEPLRPATEADLIELKLLECLPRPEAAPRAPKEPEATAMTDQAFKELLSAGPVCRHCGVTGGRILQHVPRWGPGAAGGLLG